MSIFKEYDIRGIYPTEINEEFAYKFGQAAALYFKTKITVSKDVRLSSPSLTESLIKGITDAGCDVIDAGLCSTPMTAFISKDFNCVAVTASHNPKEYNGFKVLRKGVIDVSLSSGLLDIKDLMDKESKAEKKGNVVKQDFSKEYITHVLKFADIKKRLKVVVDTGNSAQGIIIKKIFEQLNCNLVPLFFEPDGNFPNRSPDPSKPESLKTLQETVIKEKADLGVAFDGDGDRTIFIDNSGIIVPSEAILLFLAKKLMKKGETLICPINCSKSVDEYVENVIKGKVIRTKIGRTNVADAMRENNGIVGGEVSGHFFFKDNFFKDSGDITLISVISQLSAENELFSEIVKEFIKYPQEHVNIKVKSMDDIEKALAQLEKEFKGKEINKIDGITVYFDDWWFNARPSKTEPVMRLTIEADNQDILKEKSEQIKKTLEEI